MDRNKMPHETFTDKNNGLKAAQQVHYSRDFKKADRASMKTK